VAASSEQPTHLQCTQVAAACQLQPPASCQPAAHTAQERPWLVALLLLLLGWVLQVAGWRLIWLRGGWEGCPQAPAKCEPADRQTAVHITRYAQLAAARHL
jgi:hypothetical protein